MTHYLDLGFLACLVTKAPGSPLAWKLVSSLPQPLPVTGYQALQLENGLRIRRFVDDPKLQSAAAAASALWDFYKRELVFVLEAGPWEAAFDLARKWNEQTPLAPPGSTFIMHPALAAAMGCTHFLSFERRSREFALAAGLILLPGSL